MKNLILMLLLAIASNSITQAQPAYVFDTTKPLMQVRKSYEPFDAGDNIAQFICYKSDFPGMPAQGFITDIFIKIAYATPAGSKLKGLTVKMGITSMNVYPIGFGTPQFVSLEGSLTTVYYDSLFVLPATIPAGGWLKLTFSQPYQYSLLPLPNDTPQNLIVQLSQDSVNLSTLSYKFHIYDIDFNDAQQRRLVQGTKQTSGTITYSVAGDDVHLIGFNGFALSVDDPQKKVPFSVFPNPTSDKLQVSKEAKGAYEVYDLRGGKVAAGTIKEREEVNVQNLTPGMYMLKMGGKTVRFVKE